MAPEYLISRDNLIQGMRLFNERKAEIKLVFNELRPALQTMADKVIATLENTAGNSEKGHWKFSLVFVTKDNEDNYLSLFVSQRTASEKCITRLTFESLKKKRSVDLLSEDGRTIQLESLSAEEVDACYA